jgi:hypothetical protein
VTGHCPPGRDAAAAAHPAQAAAAAGPQPARVGVAGRCPQDQDDGAADRSRPGRDAAASRQLAGDGVTGHCSPGRDAAAAAHPARAGAAAGPQPARVDVAGRCQQPHDGDAARFRPGQGGTGGRQPARVGVAGRRPQDQDDVAAGLLPGRAAAAAAHRNQAGRAGGRRPRPGGAAVIRGLPDDSPGQPRQAACPEGAACSGRSAGTSWSWLRQTSAATVMTRNISVGIQP